MSGYLCCILLRSCVWGSKCNQLEDKRSSFAPFVMCLENSPVDYQNSLISSLVVAHINHILLWPLTHHHIELSATSSFQMLVLVFFLLESYSSPGVSLVHVSCIPSCTHTHTSSSVLSSYFLSCILKPRFGLATSLQYCTTLRASSKLRLEIVIRYITVIVTARDIPAALEGGRETVNSSHLPGAPCSFQPHQ